MIDAGRFSIHGDWDNEPTPAGKLRIVMPPLGHVYGGGWQPYTQAALAAVAEHIRPGMSFLEVGAGSGILCVAAKMVGAGRCIATELDKDALEAARKVFVANNVQVELVEGTFVNDQVDVAVVSISSDFASKNHQHVKAGKIIVVHDDAEVEVLAEGQGPRHKLLLPVVPKEKVVPMPREGKRIRLFDDGTWIAEE